MSGKSFYDLDHIIEINEQRLEQYQNAYENIMQKLTNIIVIYSAMAIFLIPIVRMVFWGRWNWAMGVCFGVFAVLFMVSALYAVRLILPKELLLLRVPQLYYDVSRKQYEKKVDERPELENLLKAAYITELELVLNVIGKNLKRKIHFYGIALNFN